MKKSLLCTIALAALLVLLAPRDTKAQYAYGVSDIASSRVSRQVYGYSATWLDYYAGYYYDPAVQGELYWQHNNEVPLSKGYTEGYADWIPAEVWTVTSVYQPVTNYTVYSNHFVRAYYYYSTCSSYGFAGGCYSDPYGFSSFLPGGGSGGYGGFGFNPYYYTSSRRYYLGTTAAGTRTASDQCAAGMSFDEVGASCPFTPTPVATPTPQVNEVAIGVDNLSLRPDGTGGTTSTRVTVSTNPANRTVTLELQGPIEPELANFGGHVETAHTGGAAARPRGTLAARRGTTNAQGIFTTTFNAPIFNGVTRIVATAGGRSVGQNVRIEVTGLSELTGGANYNLVGTTTSHPSPGNHYGTGAANLSLRAIADAVQAEWYSTVEQIPDGEKIRYNDMSLPQGGKFDIDHDWSEASRRHGEHRVGINCDVYSANIAGTRWTRLNQIFKDNGSTDTNDETASANHWHLRFLYGSTAALNTTTAANYVPQAWAGVLAHSPNDDEWAYWTNRMSNAIPQGQALALGEAKALNHSLFYSQEYIARNRTDAEFLADCYVAYLLREPDAGGFNYWLAAMQNDYAEGRNGRDHLIRAFEESAEFGQVVSRINSPEAPPPPALCDDTQQITDCYNAGGTWTTDTCSCTYPEPEPTPEDPCYSGHYYMCY